jgi:AraC family transcriptional regulator
LNGGDFLEAKVITLPPFHVVGYKIEADIKEKTKFKTRKMRM